MSEGPEVTDYLAVVTEWLFSTGALGHCVVFMIGCQAGLTSLV